jgi:hypothetical protein
MRNCECIGIPSMFQGRLMGVGVVLPKELGFDDTTSIGKFEMDQFNAQKKYSADIKNWDEAYGKAYTNAIQDCPRCITAPCPCAAQDEFLKLHPLPVFQTVANTPPAALAGGKSTGSVLPLLLGAAYLLLS